MPPPLELPTIQNWSCHNCGGCCRQHAVQITEAERLRITEQGWNESNGVPRGQPLFVWASGPPWAKRYRLAHQPDGACVFLDERGLCRIHARFGEPAKPLACRIYPYAFHPAGKRLALSLRFSCPSVAENKGRPVTAQRADLKELVRAVVPEGVERVPPPEISPGQRLDWPDFLRCVEVLDQSLAGKPNDGGSISLRVLRTLYWVGLLGQATFDLVRGDRLDDLLDLLTQAADADVPPRMEDFAEPSRTGRMQFRLLAAQYSRSDTVVGARSGWRGRWRLFTAALRFTRGTGLIPAVDDKFKEVPFDALEPSFGPLPPQAEEMFTRYLRVKVQGLHFCGRAYYDVPFVEGFWSLALVLPVSLWLARWFAASDGRTSLTYGDVLRGLTTADHHHGYSPLFGQRGFRGRVRLLAKLDDISKLIAWYGR